MDSEKLTKSRRLRHISAEKRSRLKKSLASALARARTIVPSSIPSTILGRLQAPKQKNPERLTPQKKSKKNLHRLTPQKKIKKKLLERLTPREKIKKQKILERFTPQKKQIKKWKKSLPTLTANLDSPDGNMTTLVRKQAFSQIPSLKRAGEVDNKRNSYRKVRFFWEESQKENTSLMRVSKPAQTKNLLFLKPKSTVQHLWNIQMEDFLQFPSKQNLDWSKTKERKIIFTFNNLWPFPLSFEFSGVQNAVLPQTTIMQLTTDVKTASFKESYLPKLRAAAEEPEVFLTTDGFQNNKQEHQGFLHMSDLSCKSEDPDVSLPCVWGLVFLTIMLDVGYG